MLKPLHNISRYNNLNSQIFRVFLIKAVIVFTETILYHLSHSVQLCTGLALKNSFWFLRLFFCLYCSYYYSNKVTDNNNTANSTTDTVTLTTTPPKTVSLTLAVYRKR